MERDGTSASCVRRRRGRLLNGLDGVSEVKAGVVRAPRTQPDGNSSNGDDALAVAPMTGPEPHRGRRDTLSAIIRRVDGQMSICGTSGDGGEMATTCRGRISEVEMGLTRT